VEEIAFRALKRGNCEKHAYELANEVIGKNWKERFAKALAGDLDHADEAARDMAVANAVRLTLLDEAVVKDAEATAGGTDAVLSPGEASKHHRPVTRLVRRLKSGSGRLMKPSQGRARCALRTERAKMLELNSPPESNFVAKPS